MTINRSKISKKNQRIQKRCLVILNAAWQVASQEMYQATQEAQANEGAPNDGAADPTADANTGTTEGDDVTDVEFEEVDDNSKS